MELLTAHNLSFHYPDGRQALTDVSFQISSGERVGLIGLNGAGKSTLLLCLAGVLKPRGQVEVAGTQGQAKLCRQKVGLVFQDPNDQLFMTTVFDDVAFGPQNLGISTDETRQRVTDALRSVGADGFEDRLTHHLSFGEKKRIALATVLAMEPQLLLLDEPTSNLDPKRRREFLKIITSTTQAALIATHDLAMVSQICSRVLILEDGRIVADSSPELLSNQDLLQKLGFCD